MNHKTRCLLLLFILTLFAGQRALANDNLAELYQQAKELESVGSYTEAIAVYDQIFNSQDADENYRGCAYLYKSCLQAYGLIDTGDYSGVDALVSDMKNQYVGHESLQEVLYHIGCKYESTEPALAIAMYDEVMNCTALNEVYRGCAYLHKSYLQAFDLIDQRDYSGVDTIVSDIKDKYNDHIALSEALYAIGSKYELIREPSRALEMYEQILSCPFVNEDQISKAQFHKSYSQVLSLINQGDGSGAEAAAEQFCQTHSGQSDFGGCIYTIVYRYAESGHNTEARELGKRLAVILENEEGAWQAELASDMAAICVQIENGNFIEAEEATEIFKSKYTGELASCALLFIGETYYLKGISSTQDSNDANTLLVKSISVFENDVLPNYSNDKTSGSAVHYLIGLTYWQLEQYMDAVDALISAAEIDPNNHSAVIHWLIIDSYKKLKAAGDVNEVEADAVFEWEYEALFYDYPEYGRMDHAAIQLGKLNMKKGNLVNACAYFQWFLMSADPNDARVNEIDKIVNGLQECGQ